MPLLYLLKNAELFDIIVPVYFMEDVMFGKKKTTIEYDKLTMIPVIHASICTGEQVAGFKNKETGKFEEVMLIRDGKDMDKFMEMYDLSIANIKKEY